MRTPWAIQMVGLPVAVQAGAIAVVGRSLTSTRRGSISSMGSAFEMSGQLVFAVIHPYCSAAREAEGFHIYSSPLFTGSVEYGGQRESLQAEAGGER